MWNSITILSVCGAILGVLLGAVEVRGQASPSSAFQSFQRNGAYNGGRFNRQTSLSNNGNFNSPQRSPSATSGTRFNSQAQNPAFYVYRYDLQAIKNRPVTRQIHPMILSRRSLREMNGSPVKDEELASLFEAARWAPSHFNLQPWRFVFARRDSPKWNAFLDALVPGNRKWAKDAGVLVVALSNKFQSRKGRKELIPSHSFDTGAAVMAMSLEGTARGLVVHAMGGFEPEKAAKMIGLDQMPNADDYQIEAMIAIGNRAQLASRNTEKTSQRNELDKFVLDGMLEEKIVEQ